MVEGDRSGNKTDEQRAELIMKGSGSRVHFQGCCRKESGQHGPRRNGHSVVKEKRKVSVDDDDSNDNNSDDNNSDDNDNVTAVT